MIYRIEITHKEGIFSPQAEKVEKELHSFGFPKAKVRYFSVYILDTEEEQVSIEKIARDVLVDPVIEDYCITKGLLGKQSDEILEVTYNPGVMDTCVLTVEKAIEDLGVNDIESVNRIQKYKIQGMDLADKSVFKKFLYNPLIEHIVDTAVGVGASHLKYEFKKITVDLLSAADEKLMQISKQGCLSLNIDEMRVIQEHFKSQKRNPTDCELETIAQTWSEHCYHKTFRGIIEYEETDKKGNVKKEIIDNLLKSTVMKATKEIDHPMCVSVFKDNAGIIKFTKDLNLCFKVETHNHPSSLEPYGGASTGVGGVIRDILGVGRGGFPIANTDVFCFGYPDVSYDDLEEGMLHPKRIIKGVVSGVRDYGNKMGIPTVNGAVLFDNRFIGNPLVYCGTVGLIPSDKTEKYLKPGDLIIVIGGRTGKDGIHGATFSSAELDSSEVEGLSSCVQIGNPIEEKKIMQVIKRTQNEELFTAITDCGAGGLSSAVGEIAEEYGCRVNLNKVPLKYQGLSYTEMWISESQERMVLVAPKENLDALVEIFKEEEVEHAVLGEVADTHKLELFYNEECVCSLDMDFLYNGIPRYKRKAKYNIKKDKFSAKIPDLCRYSLKDVLGSLNIASKEWVIRQYDHEVQGTNVIKPLMNNSAPQDGAVIRPILGKKKGVAIACGINPFYSDIDPYHMTALAIDEALRNVVAVGGSIKNTAILDNFSWPSPDDEQNLGALVRSAKACYDYSVGFGVPFISGKDSLYNEFTVKGKRIMIPYTLLISSISVVDDIDKTMTSTFKEAGNLIYIIGKTKDELGASEYFRLNDINGGKVPQVDVKKAKKIFKKVHKSIKNKLIESCHDISDGGLAVALSEMCFGTGFGANAFLNEVPYKGKTRDDFIFFSESASRFVVEVKKENKDSFEKLLGKISHGLIGCVSDDAELKVHGLDNNLVVDDNIANLEKIWKNSLVL